jgi:FtsP/CotA-like multicopper oxidase with cupredoxin domain
MVSPRRLNAGFLTAALATLLLVLPAAAQKKDDCSSLKNQELVRVPELIAKDGKLRRTLIVESDFNRIPFANSDCSAQMVRIFRGVDAVPPPPAKVDGVLNPLPGPTLRARVGDLIELTFLNQIDANRFPPGSIDRGESDPGGGCDVNGINGSIYPDAAQDHYPNCFHGSSTANVHFHGTHTNPGSTGDNVFLEIRPSLRTQDQANKPLVTEETVRKPFDEFFDACEVMLQLRKPLRQWPKVWKDLPASWRSEQKRLLQLNDNMPGVGRKLWPVDKKQIEMGAWPQNYVGAYPYCFRLPEYTGEASVSSAGGAHTPHTAGAGQAEIDESLDPRRPLIMGQAPGTHWYHAHKHGSTTINVSNGMTGVFIIEGKEYDDALNREYGAGWARKQPVIVINQLGGTPKLERGNGGPQPPFVINGRLSPFIKMRPGEVQLWRIANTGARSGVLFSKPGNGLEWRQLAQDGVQFTDGNYQNSLNKSVLLMPGNRADLLVKAPAAAEGTVIPVLALNTVDPTRAGTAATIWSVKITGTDAGMKLLTTAPDQPKFLKDIEPKEVKATKELVFATEGLGTGGGTPSSLHTIDGKQFEGEVGQVILLNTVEEWKIINATFPSAARIAHPFHIHINPFQVIEVFEPNATIEGTNPVIPKYTFLPKIDDRQCQLDPKKPENWKPCVAPPTKELVWWDVFPIPSGATLKDQDGNSINVPGYFRMRSRFVDYTGYYVMHCHILAHEDRGMMTVVEVAPLQSPYSHH